MKLPGMKAPAWAGGIRQWLSLVAVPAVALMLTLLVISLSVGSFLPGASLHVYLTTGAYDGSKNDNAADFLLSRRVFQDDQEPMNSSQASLDTREIDRKIPEPVATGDTNTTAKLDEKPSDFQRDAQGTCDLYRGEWFFDSSGPLYTNNSCPLITKTRNCQGNGRPDKGYENWRWKPEQCILPRFDARKFLELMRGKTLAFVGDSVARNQMESLLCILWQVDTPVNKGNRRMQKWIFRSTSTTIIRIWSSWLVHRSIQAVDFAPKGLTKVFVDIPDKTFMEFLPSFDVLVLSSGHWFTKRSAYILNDNVVGGQRWWPHQSRKMQMNNTDVALVYLLRLA